MKKPLTTKFYYTIAGLALVAGITAFFLFNNKEHEGWKEEEEEEENEGAQILGAFDMWGDMRNYPNDNLKNANYQGAYDFSLSLPEVPQRKNNSATKVEATSWVALGPKNFSGRILCLAFHPTDPNIMFAGSASGGLWKTTTGGTGGPGGISWQFVPITNFPVLGVPAIAIDPANPNVMYIGTGEVYNTGGYGMAGQNIRTFRGSYGIGILKSIDGGVNWTSSLAFPNTSIKGVQEIIIDPNNSNNVFAATSDGVYRSTNAGANWSLIYNVVMAMDILFTPGNTDSLYVACGNFGSAGAGIYRCPNALAGSPSFTKLTTGLPGSPNGRIAIGMAPDNHNIMFASIGKIPGTAGGTEAVTFGLYKSTNAGTSWTATASQPQLGSANYINNQGWYSHDVIVAPTSVNTVYLSEIDMLKSTNGGSTFNAITDWSDWNFSNSTIDPVQEGQTNIYVHADQHHLYFSPFDNTYNTVYSVTDGGVFRSTNGGASFKGLNGGLMTTQIYHRMGMSATNSNLMICGLQDNATLWYQGSAGCKRTTGGDGFYSAIDPVNDSICYGTYSYLTLYRSTTGIRNLGGTQVFNNPASAGASAPTENACFVAPLVIAPSNRSIMYTGTIYLRKYTNITAANTNTIQNSGNPVSNASAPIISIGVSQTFSDSIYVVTCPGGAASAKIFRSTDGGATLTDVTNGALASLNRYFSFVAVDPTNSKRLALAVSGFGTSHLYLSNDGGGTWNDIGGVGGTALPDVPTNIVMFDPADPTMIYVGNDLGVFVAQGVTTGATQPGWYSYNTGIPGSTIIMDIQVAPNGKLRLGTYGRGLWENDKAVFPLPVIFKDFNVTVTDNGNLLKWIVSTQTNVARYEVEYSTDAFGYKKVATLPAQPGSSNLTYSYLHAIQNTVDGYYRIKIIDLDGEVSYSSIAQVKAKQVITRFTAYPNPTTGVFKISIPGGNGTYELTVFNNAGQLVVQKKLSLLGTREITVDITPFAAGTYQVLLTDNKNKWTAKILKRQ